MERENKRELLLPAGRVDFQRFNDYISHTFSRRAGSPTWRETNIPLLLFLETIYA
jgi:hypothetical protein